MEEFFFKLGLMTQKNHTELLQKVDGLQTSIEALTKEISKLNSTIVESHADLSGKISSLVDTTKNLFAFATSSITNDTEIKNSLVTITDKLHVFADVEASDHAAFDKKLSTLTNQTAVDNHALKEYLENVEESLRFLGDKTSSLVDTTKNLSAFTASSITNDTEIKNSLVTITDKLHVFADAEASDHAAFDKKLSTLTNQTAVDNRALKEYLENVEELLRLMAANQIMNLVDK